MFDRSLGGFGGSLKRNAVRALGVFLLASASLAWAGPAPDAAALPNATATTAPVSPLTQIILVPGGGAIARVDDDAMAFGQRRTSWNIHFLSMWADPADTDKNIAFTKDLAGAMKPWSSGRVYLNFLGDEGQGRIEAGFGPEKYARLRQIKATWDPANLFRINQNIPPAAR